MRIGIMTFWESYDNYGQLLQCWALQQYLKSKGHSPYLIRYHREISCRKRGLCMCIDAIKDLVKKYNSKHWQRRFSEFRRDHLIVLRNHQSGFLI